MTEKIIAPTSPSHDQPEQRSKLETGASTFDAVAARFTARVKQAANWKHNYYGAAYATRIKQAIAELQGAIEEAERHPEIGDGASADSRSNDQAT